MKKLIIGLFAVCALCGLEAKNNTYQVDDSGCVTVGASKISGKDFNLNLYKIANCRKPTRAETTDHDPRQMNDSSRSWKK
jgi:hypothetical protein